MIRSYAIVVGFVSASVVGAARAETTHLRTEPVAIECVAKRTCAYRPPMQRFTAPRRGAYLIAVGKSLGRGYAACRYRAELRATVLPNRVVALEMLGPPPDQGPSRGGCRALPRAGAATRVELDAGTWLLEAFDANITRVSLVRAAD